MDERDVRACVRKSAIAPQPTIARRGVSVLEAAGDVRNLDAMIAQLRAAGIDVETRAEWDSEAGRFARVHDPEGNRSSCGNRRQMMRKVCVSRVAIDLLSRASRVPVRVL